MCRGSIEFFLKKSRTPAQRIKLKLSERIPMTDLCMPFSSNFHLGMMLCTGAAVFSGGNDSYHMSVVRNVFLPIYSRVDV